MSILTKYNQALANNDSNLANEIIHDDYQFILHSSGKKLDKKTVIEWLKSGDVKRSNVRILFENDDGELLPDIGLDNCTDLYEDGWGGCLCQIYDLWPNMNDANRVKSSLVNYGLFYPK